MTRGPLGGVALMGSSREGSGAAAAVAAAAAAAVAAAAAAAVAAAAAAAAAAVPVYTDGGELHYFCEGRGGGGDRGGLAAGLLRLFRSCRQDGSRVRILPGRQTVSSTVCFFSYFKNYFSTV